MIKAIIFDCFGVVVGKGFWTIYDIAGGDLVKDAAFIDDLLLRANSGTITPAQMTQEVAAQLGITPDEWRAVLDREEQPNEDLLTYIRDELKQQYKIGLLSNANLGTIEQKIPPQWRQVFDDIVVSAEVNMLKPEARIFELAAQRLGVKPEEIVFTDDLEGYLAGAQSVGMKTILYKDFAGFKQQLARVL